MTMLANGFADFAVVVIAVSFFVACVGLSYVFLRLSKLIDSGKDTVDDMRHEAVPLLTEIRTSVKNVNRELDRADGLLESAGNIAKSAERLSSLIEDTISSPLVKIVAMSAGASKAFKSLFGGS